MGSNEAVNNGFHENENNTDTLSTNEVVKNVTNKKRTANKRKRPVNNKEKVISDSNTAAENEGNDNEASKKTRPQRPRRAAASKKKPLIEQENISDEEGNGLSSPPKPRQYRRRLDSNESPYEDEDDYERSVQKRRLLHQGRSVSRRTIADHIKKLVADEGDDDDGLMKEKNGRKKN